MRKIFKWLVYCVALFSIGYITCVGLSWVEQVYIWGLILRLSVLFGIIGGTYFYFINLK